MHLKSGIEGIASTNKAYSQGRGWVEARSIPGWYYGENIFTVDSLTCFPQRFKTNSSYLNGKAKREKLERWKKKKKEFVYKL